METREKQAYLIIAHQCDEMLLTLLRMLDVPWNDIFIHMDSKNTAYQPETVEQYLKHARVFHTERLSVVWGGISLTKAGLALLKAAVSHGPYQHYHLISGVDLPIKTPEQIRDFFEANPDKEFISIHMDPLTPYVSDRVYCSHLFPDTDLRQSRWKYYADTVWIFIQHVLHLKYNRDVVFKKGSNWFSCTDGFARYLLSKEDWIIKTFTKTICSDEFFVQTLLFASPYLQNRYQGPGKSNVRAIDWKRGNPYTWKYTDLEELKNSPNLFARKIDIKKEPELVRELERLYGPRYNA